MFWTLALHSLFIEWSGSDDCLPVVAVVVYVVVFVVRSQFQEKMRANATRIKLPWPISMAHPKRIYTDFKCPNSRWHTKKYIRHIFLHNHICHKFTDQLNKCKTFIRWTCANVGSWNSDYSSLFQWIEYFSFNWRFLRTLPEYFRFGFIQLMDRDNQLIMFEMLLLQSNFWPRMRFLAIINVSTENFFYFQNFWMFSLMFSHYFVCFRIFRYFPEFFQSFFYSFTFLHKRSLKREKI